MIANNLNPEFLTEILMDFYFEQQQNLLIEVYDADDANNLYNLKAQEFIGSFNFALGSLCSRPNQELRGAIQSNLRKNGGEVTISAEQRNGDENKQQVKMTMGLALNQDYQNVFIVINKQ